MDSNTTMNSDQDAKIIWIKIERAKDMHIRSRERKKEWIHIKQLFNPDRCEESRCLGW